MNDHDDRLVPPAEVCRLLAVSRTTLRRLTADGLLNAVRPTRQRALRFHLWQVRKLMNDCRESRPESNPSA
jgi:excisionase family DNA binding protein